MITNVDPENRYLQAYLQMGRRAREIYTQYGDQMALLPVSRNKMAKKLGASVNTIKEVISFVDLWGGPSNGGLESALTSHQEVDNAPLVIPDAHFSRKDRVSGYLRAKRLGAYAAMVANRCHSKGQKLQVICLGDWWDMVSLCFYEKDKTTFGLQSVQEDIDAGADAIAAMMDEFKARVNPEACVGFHFTNGNHELRLDKALATSEHGPMLKGTTHFREIVESHGWAWNDYMIPANVDGVAYAHSLPSGVMGRPISSAKALIDKMTNSCVVGHNHCLDMAFRTNAFGQKMFGLVAGCYYDKTPQYAATTAKMWWSGVIILNGVRDGGLTRGHAAITVDDMINAVGY